MMDFIFGTVWGWVGTAGVVVLICAVVAYFLPQTRLTMLAIAGVFVSAASIYTKGSRDRAALEQRRKEAAVKKAKDDYAKIDARPDTPGTARKRMSDGSF